MRLGASQQIGAVGGSSTQIARGRFILRIKQQIEALETSFSRGLLDSQLAAPTSLLQIRSRVSKGGLRDRERLSITSIQT